MAKNPVFGVRINPVIVQKLKNEFDKNNIRRRNKGLPELRFCDYVSLIFIKHFGNKDEESL